MTSVQSRRTVVVGAAFTLALVSIILISSGAVAADAGGTQGKNTTCESLSGQIAPTNASYQTGDAGLNYTVDTNGRWGFTKELTVFWVWITNNRETPIKKELHIAANGSTFATKLAKVSGDS